jgi:hypothetical protein
MKAKKRSLFDMSQAPTFKNWLHTKIGCLNAVGELAHLVFDDWYCGYYWEQGDTCLGLCKALVGIQQRDTPTASFRVLRIAERQYGDWLCRHQYDAPPFGDLVQQQLEIFRADQHETWHLRKAAMRGDVEYYRLEGFLPAFVEF